jgi:hypothetical protein
MSEFKLKNGGKILVIVKKNHELIAKMFCDIDFYVSLESFSFKYDDYKKISNSTAIEKGQIFIPHPELNPSLSVVSGILGYKDISLVDLYKMMLNLNMKSEVAVPSFDIYNSSKARDFFSERNLDPRKTVIFFPVAATCEEVNKDFWENIIQSLNSLGFDILINHLGDNDDFVFNQKNIVRINQSLDDVVALSLLCAGIISLRSGICDLLCFTDKKIVVFYPDDKSYKDFNLKNIFEQRSNLLEIVLDKNCDQGLAEKEVLSFFS